CAGVEEALTSLQDDSDVDLIVTDLHMPGIDGWRFCQLLRSPDYAHFNHVPILVVSATFTGSDAEQLSLELGADAFLASPFAPSALEQYARALLNGQRPQPTPHVLVIHHDPAEAARLRAAFVAHGYGAAVAHSGADGLRAWRALHPDVAVVDGLLTDVPAARVLGEIKQPGSRTVAFAITSAGASGEGLQLARQGADAILPAPVDPARLLGLCEKVRRQRTLMRIEELIDERGRTQRDSEARWRSLFEAIPEIVVVHDEDGVIRHINQTGAERLGWPSHELIGRRLGELERRDHATPSALSTSNDTRVDTVYVSQTGQEIPVEVNRGRMAFEGRPAVLSVARDVSARRELARQQQTFLAMLTHDIKNPLAVVLGFIGLLGEVGDLNDEQRDLLARMEINAATVLTLVANYLHLTQIERGSLTLKKTEVAIADVIEAVIAQYRGQAERRAISLTAEIQSSLGLVTADAVAIERVLANLVHNALKFTGETGRVAISARRDDDAVVVRVRDSGIGIAPSELATIFQPYRRGTLRQPPEGIGLGLFIARSLIQAHQGRIDVESTPGAGTVFTVWLPTDAAAESSGVPDA
ncbi:MAG: ATP-binding protein, partial [Gemmatimonadales bacterium]